MDLFLHDFDFESVIVVLCYLLSMVILYLLFFFSDVCQISVWFKENFLQLHKFFLSIPTFSNLFIISYFIVEICSRLLFNCHCCRRCRTLMAMRYNLTLLLWTDSFSTELTCLQFHFIRLIVCQDVSIHWTLIKFRILQK